MHKFYTKLNLPPKEKLLDYDQLPVGNAHLPNLFKMFSPGVLTKEATDFFADHNLTVKFVLNFITPLSLCPGTEATRVLHTDNRTIDGVRHPIHCGINFELSTPTDTSWIWYNMDSVCNKVYREHVDSSDFEKEIKMRAEVYNEKGVPEGAVPIERLNYTADDIYLIRTDIPHIVTFNSYNQPRRAISIRFEETWNSWEECWEVFKPLMKEEIANVA
jgi:hypothetical protein